MATYVSNRDSEGRTDEKGHFKFLASSYVGNILNDSDMQTVEQSAPGMSVRVSQGDIRIPYSNYAYTAWSEGYTGVSIATADPSNPRIDRVVAYIDRGMTFLDSDTNNPGALKFKAVSGTPNAVPSKASDVAVQSSIGATNPWVEISTVQVGAGVLTIVNANITDTRVFASAKNASNSISLSMMQDNSVSSDELVNLAAVTRKLRPTYMRQAGNNGGSRQYYANTTVTIVGTSLTYTSGPTNEVLWLKGFAMCNLLPGSQLWIQDGTTPISKSWYAESPQVWRNYAPDCFFDMPANTTKTFSMAANGGGGDICNSISDTTSSPSFSVELRLLAFGRT